jgi:excisionase family DNA binding protein
MRTLVKVKESTRPERWLRTQEAAEYTGWCTRTIRRKVHEGKLKVYVHGTAWRFRRADLDECFRPLDDGR